MIEGLGYFALPRGAPNISDHINKSIVLRFINIMPTTVASTLSVKTLLEINAALSSLEGTQTVVKGEEGKSDKVITVPYQFSGKVRWNIAKGLTALKRVSEDFTKARDAVINEVSGGTGRIEPDDEVSVKALNDKIAEIFASQESTSGLLSLPLEGLNLDVNQISPSILSVLEPVIAE
jgi:hypothetical protein